jgi:regulator of replication initiation timing
MEDLRAELQRIRNSVTQLVTAYQVLKMENTRLRMMNSELTAAVDEERKKNEDLENKNLNLQLTRSFGKDTKEKDGLRQRLDELIREIETCITHMNG